MDYLRVYNLLVEHAKLNPPSGYKEEHHIVPKAEGGSDDKSNLVSFTFRLHFFAHKLLARIYNSKAMWFAYHMMCNKAKSTIRISSKEYEKVKAICNANARAYRHTEEAKQKMRENHGFPSDVDAWKEKLRKARKGKKPALGMHHTELTKKMISASAKKMWQDENIRKKMANRKSWNKGTKGLYKASDLTRKKMSESHKNPSQETRHNNGKAFRGKHWYNNGEIETAFFENEAPPNFIKGRLKKKS